MLTRPRAGEVRALAGNLLGEEGSGFAMTQTRLCPGRIHHCVRLAGAAERALWPLIVRAEQRTTFGTPVAQQSLIREGIDRSRIEIGQARLYTMYAAWPMDTSGNKAVASQISGIKVAAPQTAARVTGQAMQVFSGAGLPQGLPLSHMYANARVLRIAGGPGEVRARALARTEIRRHAKARRLKEPVLPHELVPR